MGEVINLRRSPGALRRERSLRGEPLKQGWYLSYTERDRDTGCYSFRQDHLPVEGIENREAAVKMALEDILMLEQVVEVHCPRVSYQILLWV